MALMGTRTSGYRTYTQYELAKNDNKEIETTFNWDIEFIKKPTGVYLPPDLLIKLRLLTLQPPTFSLNPPLEAQVGGGYSVYQPGQNDYSHGQFMATCQDFIDQSIEYAFRELSYEYDRPKDRTSKPKQECLWDADIFQLDSQDRPVKVYRCRDCLLSGFDKPDQMDSQKALGGVVTLTWQCGLFWIEQLNVVPVTL